jgi:hypothetical protein
MKKLLLALAMLFGFQTLAFAQLSGPATWTSQRGSVLKVTSLSRGTSAGYSPTGIRTSDASEFQLR